jgi:pSer/pThr/pTyr-binding forkhead associated (FHA) protein
MGSSQIGITVILNGRVAQRLEFTKDRILVGRSSECDVRIDDVAVSRSHAEIVANAGVWSIADLESSNGTLLNGKSLRSAALHNGDIVQIGQFSLHVGIVDGSRKLESVRAAMRREEQTVPKSSARRDPSPWIGPGPTPPGAS